MSKFIRQVFGSVHFKTRFLPFIENNKETAHNYIYLVDNYELYEPYKNLLTIIDIEDARKNHPWSTNDIEVHYKEKDPELYAKNFHQFYKQKNSLLPFCTMRFLFPYMYENNILKFSYVGNNVFITNQQKIIDNFFKKIPEGVLGIPHIGPMDETYSSPIFGHIGNLLKSKFPQLTIPEDYWYCELFTCDFSFKNKEDIKLFYEIFDYITYCYNFSDNIHIKNHFFQKNHGYTKIDDIVGYLLRIFEINFNYKIKNRLHYWEDDTLGFHMSTPHDSWYYSNMLPNWNLLPPNKNETVFTTEEYIKKNKDALINYYNNHATHATYNITENNNIIIKHKNI
jgi:hypothetical protein